MAVLVTVITVKGLVSHTKDLVDTRKNTVLVTAEDIPKGEGTSSSVNITL